MPKAVSGFLSSDEIFFDREVDADLHDAELVLRTALGKYSKDPESVIETLRKEMEPIRRYFDAFEASVEDVHDTRTNSHPPGQPGETETDPPNNGAGEEDDAREQQQPRSRRQPVPNLGRRKRTKEVQDPSKKHGA